MPVVAPPTNTLTIQNVEKIRPGKSTSSDIKTIFGTPDREFFSDGAVILSESGQYKIWQYNRDATTQDAAGRRKNIRLPRLSLSFEEKTGRLLNVNWSVYEDDTEKNLAVLKSRFRTAQFKKSEEEPLCAHLLPEEVYFEDSKAGLTITWLKTKKEVTSISWSIPGQSRSVANQESIAIAKNRCRIWQ